MFLIDKPYVSDFLLETISRNNYPVVATRASKALLKGTDYNWISEPQAAEWIKGNPTHVTYTNSENSLSWFLEHVPDHPRAGAISRLKDKLQFRELMEEQGPGPAFRSISLEDIQMLTLDDLELPCVIKPRVGFLSIGVHIILDATDFQKMQAALKIDKLSSIFPASVLNVQDFMIEAFADGDEFAIDYVYDDDGQPIILNIFKHQFASKNDTRDRLYSTSKSLIQNYTPLVLPFLTTLGESLNLRGFPAHAEVKINASGQVVPIEVNPMRFGGWCTTADLLGVLRGYNVYEHLMRRQAPDWNAVFEDVESQSFNLVIIENNQSSEDGPVRAFKWSKFESDFKAVRHIRALNPNIYPVHGFAFLETGSNNNDVLDRILALNVDDYLI